MVMLAHCRFNAHALSFVRAAQAALGNDRARDTRWATSQRNTSSRLKRITLPSPSVEWDAEPLALWQIHEPVEGQTGDVGDDVIAEQHMVAWLRPRAGGVLDRFLPGQGRGLGQ